MRESAVFNICGKCRGAFSAARLVLRILRCVVGLTGVRRELWVPHRDVLREAPELALLACFFETDGIRAQALKTICSSLFYRKETASK